MEPSSSRNRSSSDVLTSLQSVHDHVLPPGWSCKYDPQNKKYYFIYEAGIDSEELERMENWRFDTASTSLSPSLRFKIKATAFEANVDRIWKQFPNVEKSHINYLMKIYNNRENLVISALLSESYTRHDFVLDEALFYKLKQSFPHIEPDFIRRLLVQNENKEHPTIAALLNLFGLFNTTRYEHSKKPQLKLKYLKFAFPKIDEIVLLDLLFKHNYDVSKVIKYLKSIGQQSQEIIEIKLSKISETAILKEASDRLCAPRPKSLLFQTKYHPNLWEQEDIRKVIVAQYPSINIFLINRALEATKFDIELTKLFLDSMTPQDSAKYLMRSLPDPIIPIRNIRISKQVQTNSIAQDLFGKISFLDLGESNGLMDSDVEKFEKSTWTKEDGIYKKITPKLAIGSQKENRKGPDPNSKTTKLHQRIGPIIVRKGPDVHNKCGSEYKINESNNKKIMRQGPEETNRKGAMGKQMIRLKEIEFENDLDFISFIEHYYYYH